LFFVEFFVGALASFAAAAGWGFEDFPHFDGVDEWNGYDICAWIGFASSGRAESGCRCRQDEMELDSC
jgi:hypothetical protein